MPRSVNKTPSNTPFLLASEHEILINAFFIRQRLAKQSLASRCITKAPVIQTPFGLPELRSGYTVQLRQRVYLLLFGQV